MISLSEHWSLPLALPALNLSCGQATKPHRLRALPAAFPKRQSFENPLPIFAVSLKHLGDYFLNIYL